MKRVKKLLLPALIVLALLAGSQAVSLATPVNSLPGGTIIAMPGTNNFGVGPQTFTTNGPGGPVITWTATSPSAVFGYTGEISFGENGVWDGALGPAAGAGAPYGFFNTMTFTFSKPVSGVGGFINLAADDFGIAYVTAVGSNDIYEIQNLAHGPLGSGAVNQGMFYGFLEDSAIITSFSLMTSSNSVALTGLTAVPLPAAWTLLLAGFGLVGFARRKRLLQL